MIVEDEVLAQQVIQSHLEQFSGFELVAVCANAIEAGVILDRTEIDLIFLDIQLPGMTGLNFLRTLSNPPLVVLTTAYAEYAVESYEFNIIDYLLKPISFTRFSRTVNRILDWKVSAKLPASEISPDHIFIKSNGRFFKVNLSDIVYVESMKDYLKIHATEYTLVTHLTMGEMEKLLPPSRFLRVHKSYIAAIAHIRSIYGNSIDIQNVTIPIGNNYKDGVMKFISGKY